MTKQLSDKIKESIHRDTYVLTDKMKKTGQNYLFNVAFVAETNALIGYLDASKELLDLDIVNEIYSRIYNKIMQMDDDGR